MRNLVFSDKGDYILLRLPYFYRITSLLAALLITLGIFWGFNEGNFAYYILLAFFLLSGLFREIYILNEQGIKSKIGFAFLLKTKFYKREDIKKIILDNFIKGSLNNNEDKTGPGYTKYSKINILFQDESQKTLEVVKTSKVYDIQSNIDRMNSILNL